MFFFSASSIVILLDPEDRTTGSELFDGWTGGLQESPDRAITAAKVKSRIRNGSPVRCLTLEEGGPNGQPDIRERTEIQPIVDEVSKRPLGPTQRLVSLHRSEHDGFSLAQHKTQSHPPCE
jgi:hypothetical protein